VSVKSAAPQAAFPVPRNLYDSIIVPHSRSLLRELGRDAPEFKGTRIKRGNVRTYREFLRLFTGVSIQIADHAPLYPVVALDGMVPYQGQQFQRLRWNVAGALDNLGVRDANNIVDEFSRQMLWLHRHLPFIAPHGFRNEVEFIADEKHSYVNESREPRFFSGKGLAVATQSSLETVLTSCARTLLSHGASEMRMATMGRVARFRFARSPAEFGLQAADVLSHLQYSALRAAVGIEDDTTCAKAELLAEVMPDFRLDAELRSKLTVVNGKDGRPEVMLTDRGIRSRFQILPAEPAQADM
jgi:hypothetical protein